MVWDRFVRGFHWSLAATIAVAAGTGFLADAPWIDIHIWSGTAALALVIARSVWGFLGTRHARFADFVAGPRSVLAHVLGLATGRAERHLGHNPVGGAMILALIATIFALTATGAVALGGVFKAGPFAFATSFATGWDVRAIHEWLAIALLVLVGLHVAGALFESWRTQENLIGAMVGGRKQARPKDHAPKRVSDRPVAAIAIAATLFAVSGTTVWALAARPPRGAPIAALDSTYKVECGACHVAYHPSLLPRASWTALMAGLNDHFGENATLDAETAQHISAYLTANAAEAYDTKPANRLRWIDPASPFAITAAPFWKSTHRDLSTAVFSAKAVGGRGNCNACHADAALGRFYPGAIDIPEETKP